MAIRVAVTPGEPAGIGPDLCVILAQQPPADIELVLVADPQMLARRAALLGLPLRIRTLQADSSPLANAIGELTVMPARMSVCETAGQLDPANARYVLDTLGMAVDLCRTGVCTALVTGPVHKGNINQAGVAFTGHTELLAELCGVDLTVMMLATEGLRVALVTTHLPLSEVPTAITRERLDRVLTILAQDLRSKFGIHHPRILVCGLNPHAGEGGHLGHEEVEVIEPVLSHQRQLGLDVKGPLPADTLFTPRHLEHADAVLAMYHDQGLPVLKFKGFGRACNITLGLPIIRTSVDHGTALDLAGTGAIQTGSLTEAIRVAVEMARHWQAATRS